MSSKSKYWIDLSDYDLDTAIVMLKGKRYLYVGFMCHQTIEKAFKAYYVLLNPSEVPYTHSLSLLAKKGGFWDFLSEGQRSFTDLLEPLSIETRYPSHKERLLQSLNEVRSQNILEQTKALQLWIKERLSAQ